MQKTLFSNRFKLHDTINTLKDMLERTYSASRSIDAGKYIYNQTVGQVSMVSKLMREQLDSARNTIIGARNQSVIIDGAGIHISCDDADDPYIQAFEMRIVNGMLALTRDNWNSVELAIGVFKTSRGYHSGVNAQVLAGNLIIGHDLIIENPLVDEHGRETGIMQFKVDATGAWLYNSRFVMQSDKGGKMIFDPHYGIVAGTGDLFTTSGTDVTPSFIKNGEIEFDSYGIPKNANFYIDARDGSAYFRGNGVFTGDVYAHDGIFSGIVKATDFQDASGNSLLKWTTKEDGTKVWKWDCDFLDLEGVEGRVTEIENGYQIVVKDYNNNIAAFTHTVDGFRTDVQSYQEAVDGYHLQVSSFEQTTQGFRTDVQNIQESFDRKLTNYSTITQTAEKIATAVTSVNQSVDSKLENYSTITQTSEGISTAVSSMQTTVEGNITKTLKNYSTITQTANEIATAVTSVNQSVDSKLTNFSTISQTADKIATAVTSVNETTDKKLLNYSTITQTADSISTAVANVNQSVDTKLTNYSTITQTANKITSEVGSMKTTIEGDVERTLKNYSTITQTSDEISLAVYGKKGGGAYSYTTDSVYAKLILNADKISWVVASGTNASNFTMTDRAAKLVADKIDLKGFVSFSDLSTKGKTTISGDNITTGTISADRVKLNKLYAGNNTAISASGNTLTVGGSGQSSTLATIYLSATNIYSYGNFYTNLLLPNGGGTRIGSSGSFFADGYFLNLHATTIMSNGSGNIGTSSSRFNYAYLYGLDVNGNAKFTGSIGFFGSSGSYKQTVSESAELKDLIRALKSYGLV